MEEELGAEVIQKELMKNQTFLEQENQELRAQLERLNGDFELLKENTVLESDFKVIEEEFEKLQTLNKYLKVKIKNVKNTAGNEENSGEIEDVLKKLNAFIDFCQKPNRFLEFSSNFNLVSSVITNLRLYSRRLNKKRRSIENETLKFDVNRENELLRGSIIETQHLITELEVENLKLKLEMEGLEEETQNLQAKLKQIEEELEKEVKINGEIDVEVENMKGKLSECEAEELDLKVQLNQELNNINKAKRDAINAEINAANIKETLAVIQSELRKAQKMWKQHKKHV